MAFLNFISNYFHPEKSFCISAPGVFSYTAVQYVYGMVAYPALQGTVGFPEGVGIWRSCVEESYLFGFMTTGYLAFLMLELNTVMRLILGTFTLVCIGWKTRSVMGKY